MSDSFFDRLEVELSSLTREGTHLDRAARRRRRRLAMLLRHGVVMVILALALAMSLDSEFAASASGSAVLTHDVSVVRSV